MNAAETIQAAIDRLSVLRDATQGTWLAWKQHSPLCGMQYGVESGRGDEVYVSGASLDVEIVETLHRTIDAQLAILRDCRDLYDNAAGSAVRVRRALELARAILGGAK